MAIGIVERYLAGEAQAFFPSDYRERASRQRAVQRAARPLRPEVAAALEAQNAGYEQSAARQANLAALRAGCAAVVTGQQVGLLLGPLYTVYKAASAVAVARALQAETGTRVVPVFWLQSEDHDLPEIAECHLLRGDCELTKLALPAPDTRISIAHVALPDELRACLTTLRTELGAMPEAEAHLGRIERHYAPGRGYVQAFAGMLAELFADDGLVLLDPRTPELAQAGRAVHERALREAGSIAEVLLERVEALRAAGGSAPVYVRPGAPLSFFHPHGSEGPRYRLATDGETLREVGGQGAHSLPALLRVLADEPLRFSTSALLRPILQDSLLPTAAYVGGPGEIAYFAQMQPLYEAYQLPMPLIVPRARFVVVEPKAQRLLSRYTLSAARAHESLESLVAACRGPGEQAPSPAELEQRLGAGVKGVLREVLATLPDLGSELSSAAEKTQAAIDKALSRFAQKYQSALLHKDGARAADLRRLKQLLHPGDAPQERMLCLSSFAARHGERAFLDQVRATIDPWDCRVQELRP